MTVWISRCLLKFHHPVIWSKHSKSVGVIRVKFLNPDPSSSFKVFKRSSRKRLSSSPALGLLFFGAHGDKRWTHQLLQELPGEAWRRELIRGPPQAWTRNNELGQSRNIESECALAFTYFVWRVCVGGLSYPPYNAHAPCCHLRPLWLHHVFPFYLINDTIFERKKKLLNIKCVLIFLKTCITNISHFNNNLDFLDRFSGKCSNVKSHTTSCSIQTLFAILPMRLKNLFACQSQSHVRA
jgi:hypothetical protein